MNTEDENLLVRIVRKVIGLPTGNSGCSCAASVTAANSCCTAEDSGTASKDCGCASAPVQENETIAEA